MKTWHEKLKKLRQADAAKQPKPAQLGQVDDLLTKVQALAALRDMSQYLLNGSGRIELFEDAEGYDLMLALLWQGPISQAERPRGEVGELYHIFVGVRGRYVYVNGTRLRRNTPEALQAALLKAAENPGRRKNLSL